MEHRLHQLVVTIGAPRSIAGEEGRRVLAAFYGELLGMQIIDEQWLRISRDRTSTLQLALDSDGWSDERPPRWPDPDFPQQMHLDVLAPDLGAAGELVVGLGAKLLLEAGDHRTYTDPAGHPFCLYPDPSGDTHRAAIGRVVFDCFSPRSLAAFYEGLLGVTDRTEDSEQRVVIALDDERYPDLAFQHAQFVAARWPDPAYPAQLHLDLRFGDGKQAAQERAERLGAIRLPKLADTEIYADPAGHPFCL